MVVLGACLAVACVAGGILFLQSFQSNRELLAANQRMKAELQVAQTTGDTLLAERQELANQVQVFRDLAERLQSQVTDLSNGNSSDSASDSQTPVVSPYQAQAYLGRKPIGWVWIIPQNLRRDTNSQRYVYEPIVWLDESVRKQFVTHHTNIVEREVETVNYVSPGYYSAPIYYASWPLLPSPPLHYPPGMTNCPPLPLWPSQPIQPVAQQPFNPGNGKVTMQKLGTPAGAIKTRAVP